MNTNNMKYQFLPNTADIKFQAYGNSIEDAFTNSAYALVEIMCKEKIKDALVTKIKVNGKDFESLLVNFLGEFLFLLDSQNFILNKINRISKIQLNKNKEYELTADISGDNAKNYEIAHNIKAITYNDMLIEEKKNKWLCQVVVDV